MTQPPPLPPPHGYGPPPPTPRTNVAAIISLICGALGCIPFVTSLAAVILGFFGLSSARKPQGSGKGLAIAGLTLGIIGLLGWGAIVGTVGYGVAKARQIRSEQVAKALDAVAALGVGVPVGSQPAAPEKYETLIGEDFQGSAFLISHRGSLWGVCSLHQFDRQTPSEFIQLVGDDIQLDRAAVIKQRDVQAIGVSKAPGNVPYLSYQPRFTLKEGDEVLVFSADDTPITGTLTRTGLRGGSYDSTSGPRRLEIRTTTPFEAGGGSGGPVILKRTNAVIGVLLTADDPKQATQVGFETLCLPE